MEEFEGLRRSWGVLRAEAGGVGEFGAGGGTGLGLMKELGVLRRS